MYKYIELLHNKNSTKEITDNICLHIANALMIELYILKRNVILTLNKTQSMTSTYTDTDTRNYFNDEDFKRVLLELSTLNLHNKRLIAQTINKSAFNITSLNINLNMENNGNLIYIDNSDVDILKLHKIQSHI